MSMQLSFRLLRHIEKRLRLLSDCRWYVRQPDLDHARLWAQVFARRSLVLQFAADFNSSYINGRENWKGARVDLWWRSITDLAKPYIRYSTKSIPEGLSILSPAGNLSSRYQLVYPAHDICSCHGRSSIRSRERRASQENMLRADLNFRKYGPIISVGLSNNLFAM
jgi:hypothetical protein